VAIEPLTVLSVKATAFTGRPGVLSSGATVFVECYSRVESSAAAVLHQALRLLFI